MTRVLLIQSRKTPQKAGAEVERFRRATGGEVSLSPTSSVDSSVDWDKPAELVRDFDAVFFGGSSDFFFDGGRGEADPERAGTFEVLERMKPLVHYLLEEKIPTLAVCLGHQIVAEMFGGRVTHDHGQRKMGTFPVFLNDAGSKDKLFSRMPSAFTAQYAHRDSVTSLPSGATLLAEGPACRFSALRYGDAMYTLQFHPELIASDLLDNQEAIAEYLPEGQSVGEVVQESPESNAILGGFLDTFISTKHRGFRPQKMSIATLDSGTR